jgi:hypothetical protein
LRKALNETIITQGGGFGGWVNFSADETTEGALRLRDPHVARRATRIAAMRHRLKTGDMWNSNSVIAWLIARSRIDAESIHPPTAGRAPGWQSGLLVARPPTGVGTCGTRSSILVDVGDRPVAPATYLVAKDPKPGAQRIPTGPSATTPRCSPWASRTGACSITNRAAATRTSSAEWYTSHTEQARPPTRVAVALPHHESGAAILLVAQNEGVREVIGGWRSPDRDTAAQDEGSPRLHDGHDQADLRMKVHRVADLDRLPLDNDPRGAVDVAATRFWWICVMCPA